MKKRILSLLLAAAMLLSLIPGVFAEQAEIPLTNGDFENGLSGWSVTGWATVEPDGNSQVNTTNALSFWMDEVTEASASYTVRLTSGTYHFSFEISGDSKDSLLSYKVTSGDEVLATGSQTYTTTGWDKWATYTTSDFTLSETKEVTFTLGGTQPDGYWGHFDNLKLYGTGAIDLPMNELTLENGDFENGDAENWVLSGYTEVADDEYATNNPTNALTLFLSNDTEAAGSAAYTVRLTAGTYYFTFDLAIGANGDSNNSGLSYRVSSGESELAKGDETYTATGWNVWKTYQTKQFTLSEEADVTFTLSGTQPAGIYGDLDNLKLYGTGEIVSKRPDPVEADIYVPYVAGTTDADGFMRGLDVSSVLSIYNSWNDPSCDGSAHFKDFTGKELTIQEFFNLLHDSGTNYIRLRVWNDPFKTSGEQKYGYGGGNNDVAAALEMGRYATNAGMKVLIDFHYSDFWADPGKQQVPKAWKNKSVDEKATLIEEFTYESLKTLIEGGVDVGMVQVGNETTSGICGETTWQNMAKLFSAGSKGVRRIAQEKQREILVAIHFTNPEKGNYPTYAKNLQTYGVDYDVFASSWYPYWHGTLDNLTSTLKTVADTYDKKVIVAETSWAYTLDDGDGHENTVKKGNNDSNPNYEFSAQGQASLLSDAVKAVRAVGEKGVGVFYWEPAWIPVQVYTGNNLNANKALWEKYGSGWAASYANEYDSKDAGQWFGGSAVDNQALFTFDGTPLPSLRTYSYIQTGTSGFDIKVSSVENPTLEYLVGDELQMPETVHVTYNFGSPDDRPVTWDEDELAAVDMDTPGSYQVHGTVSIDESITTDGPVTTVCTVNVKYENLLLNPSFESSTMSMYHISATARRTNDDPHSGTYSLHFYSDGTVNFTADQTVTLNKGHYVFSLYAQGGDIGSAAKTYAYVKFGETNLQKSFTLTGWAAWVNPTIEFDVTEDETSVTVGANITASQTGAWGTLDDWYLGQSVNPTHVWDNGVVTQEPTCVDKGVKTFTCSVCDATRTEDIDPTGQHTWDNGVVTKDPTCVDKGVKTFTCTVCKTTRTEDIDPTGEHTWDNGVVTKDPTCVDKGVKTFTCTVCKTTRTEDIDPTGQHTWDNGVVTKDPTCVDKGVKTFTCTVCKTTRTEDIDPTGQHTWDNGVVTKDPTCVDKGVKTFTCTVCKTTRTEDIDPTGEHTWDNGVVTKDPTCVDKGVKTFTCTVCKTTRTEDVEALGHDWTEWETVLEATDVSYGLEARACKRCDKSETRETLAETCLFEDYTDLDAAQWYHANVEFAIANGLMGGTASGIFEPESTLTRGMLVTILYRLEGEPSVAGFENPFDDVAEDCYYTDAVIWAAHEVIINGRTETEFMPEDAITREEVATILYRYSYDPQTEGDLTRFSDANSVSEYAKYAVSWAVAKGILLGDNGELRPQDGATRAELAAMLTRYLKIKVK